MMWELEVDLKVKKEQERKQNSRWYWIHQAITWRNGLGGWWEWEVDYGRWKANKKIVMISKKKKWTQNVSGSQ
jgi:hypothetical protein